MAWVLSWGSGAFRTLPIIIPSCSPGWSSPHASTQSRGPSLQASADTVDHMLSVLAHLRAHSPTEFCGLQSTGEFLRLMAGVLAGCGGLTAAWLISTSTSPVINVVPASPGGNWTTNVGG